MKKFLVSLVLLFSLFFSFGGVESSAGGGKNYSYLEQKATKIINQYFEKYVNKYGKEKTINIFKNINKKVFKLRKKSDDLDKKNLLALINRVIYYKILDSVNENYDEKIVKDFGNGIIVKQKKNGIGYTNVYLFGKKFFTHDTLNLAFCNPYVDVYDCYVDLKGNDVFNLDKNTIDKIKNQALKTIYLTDKGVEDKKSGYKIFSILGYEGLGFSAIIDINNKKVYNLPFLQIVDKLKKGKNGIYFINTGLGLPGMLYFISNNGVAKKIFGDENNFVEDYELLYDNKIKVFYIHSPDYNKNEKIIKIMETN